MSLVDVYDRSFPNHVYVSDKSTKCTKSFSTEELVMTLLH